MARHRILLVDDEEDLTESLVRRLSKALPEVEFIGETSGEAALRRLADKPFSTLVTDIRMPGIGGVELILRARALAPGIQCVVMTAYSTEQVRSEVSRHDWVTFIEKPFELSAIVELLSDLIEEPPPSGFKGAMLLETLPDLLQLFILAHTTGALRVWHRGCSGAIWFDRGELTHAATPDLAGVAAFNEIVTWAGGEFSVERDCAAPVRTIFESPTALLMEAYRVLDESRRSAQESVRPEGRRTVRSAQQEPQPTDDADPFASAQSWIPREAAEPAEIEAAGTIAPMTVKSSSAAASTYGVARGARDGEEREREMGKIDDACRKVVDKVDGAVACGVVDLDTGMLLGIFNAAQYTQSLNEIVAAATMDLFRGPNVGRIEQMVRARRGVPENGEHYFQEIHITSEHNFHFAKTIRDGKAVIMLVTRKTTNVGMGWAQLKSVIPDVEPLVP